MSSDSSTNRENEKDDTNHTSFAKEMMKTGLPCQTIPPKDAEYQRQNDDSNSARGTDIGCFESDRDGVRATMTMNTHNSGEDDDHDIIQQNDDDEYCWEDISFRSEAKDDNGKDRYEQTNFGEEEKQENKFFQAVAGWFKPGPKSDDDSQHDEILLAQDADTKSTVSPLAHTTEELKGPKESYESKPQRNRFSGVLRWWAADDNHEDESSMFKGQTASDVYGESTSHSSDVGSVDNDYEASSTDLMVSALDWIHSNDNHVAEDNESVSSGLGSLASGYGSVGDCLKARAPSDRTPKRRSRDLKKVVQWMRKGKGKGQRREDKYDPTGDYRKLDSMLPKKKGMTPEDRAREIESSLDWLRSQQDIPADEEATIITESEAIDLSTLGPAPICVTSPEDRQEELRNIMSWIRNKGKGMKNKYDPSGNFRKLDKLLPRKRRQKPEDRAREIERVMDWMRNSGLIPKGETTLPELLEKLQSFHFSRRTPEERAKDLEDVMSWIMRDETSSATGDFSKLNLILEAKKGQSNEDRAKQIECALDWFRNNNECENDSLSLLGGRESSGSRKNTGYRPQRRRRTSSPKRKRNPDAKIPKLIGVPLVEEGPDLFASIGRIVHVVAPPSDVSTMIPTADDDQGCLVDIAQAKEIVDAIALLMEPDDSAEDLNAAVVTEGSIFGDDVGNWWEESASR